MNKALIIAGFVAASILGLLFLTEKESAEKNSNEKSVSELSDSRLMTLTSNQSQILEYVPADTLYFLGGLEALPFRTALEFQASLTPIKYYEKYPDKRPDRMFLPEADDPSAIKFLHGLYGSMMDLMTSPALINLMPEKIDAAHYAINTMPVIRIKFAPINVIEMLINDIESKAGILPEVESVSGVSYRSYSFDQSTDQSKSNVSLVIAFIDTFVIISLKTDSDDENTLSRRLGIKMPKRSIKDTHHLENMQVKHGLLPYGMGFLSHEQVINGLTDPGGTAIGQIFDRLSRSDLGNRWKEKIAAHPVKPSTYSDRHKDDEWRNAACRADLQKQIADKWPQTIMGTLKLNVSAGDVRLNTQMILESRDQSIATDLLKLRGHIPDFLQSRKTDPAFSLAVGLKSDALVPFYSGWLNYWSDLKLQCQPLIEMQTKLKANQDNGASVAMFSTMASGLQGFSATLLNFDIKQKGDLAVDNFNNIDAFVTVSASNPQTLLLAASSMAPAPYKGLQIPLDGTSVNLPFPLPLPDGVEPKIALKGNHIIAYLGRESERIAQQMSTEPLSSNGILLTAIDYSKYDDVIKDRLVGSISSENEQLAAELGEVEIQDMAFNFVFDFTKNGIVFDTEIKKK